ncbi:hypothetical protein K1Y72_27285 [Actinomadura sp. PM05-2]|uniref:Uncharacterized protein n=2 Tax=Actinomadura parmotrematis TaxID=2864039 RepID=A0ABS7G073_9ACTN|nr:hypothetical protein [Actinomadura parmotrematis]
MSSSSVLGQAAARLVIAGTMGPTVHDVHAWRLKVVDGLIEVHADPERFRAMGDPAGRGLHISCGAALVNLRLAAAQIGRDAVVRLLPDAARPAVLATVRLAAGRHKVNKDDRLLYAATLTPFPARRSPVGTPPSLPVVNVLAEAARLEGATLHLLPSADPDEPAEGPRQAVITTPGNGPAEWLRAGQALQRVLLTATTKAVAASFLYELVDVPGVGGLAEAGDVPQVALELCQALKGPVLRDDERQGHRERVG